MQIKSIITLSLLLISGVALGQEDDMSVVRERPTKKIKFDGIDFNHVEELLITGSREEIKEMPGSAHLIDKEELETFDYTDINRVMSKVPGVYIRNEDGYGLRPNIGLRGATSERSQKVTLMEDGILITPAPYSAPAAYYLPNVNRMQAVEVFKGPSAIAYGPHTVGGAINLVSRPTPSALSREVNASVGTDGFQKFYGYFGDRTESLDYGIELLGFSGDGFKELDGGGDVGFERNDINVRFNFDFGDELEQTLDVKLGYADEDSNETYLGISDADFDLNPNRRYRASQMDHFVSEHQQLHAFYDVKINDKWSIHTKVYFNRFERSWNKFDGFIDGPYVSDVLRYPNIFIQELALLRGEVDSNGSDAQLIDVTNNDRDYGSQGIELKSTYQYGEEARSHELSLGLRFHHDYVDRHHSVRGYNMQSGSLVFDGVDDRPLKALNKGETDALAIFIKDQITLAQWDITLGLRYESIDNHFNDRLNLPESPTQEELEAAKNDRTTSITVPGFGVFYQYTDNLGFLFGVNKGFSPNGPSSTEEVDPEESTNTEIGLRYYKDQFNFEVIGFLSDYENLIGRCRVSDVGCIVGEEFNGGAVEIAGIEITSRYTKQFDAIDMPVSLTYTYTESAFQTGFASNFSQWSNVEKGDSLPYLPENALRVDLGLEAQKWNINLGFHYVDEMREEPGYGDIRNGVHTKSLMTVDVAATWVVNDYMALQLTVDNLTDEQEIVSRRPFGGRPSKPQSMILTAKLDF